MFKIPNTFPTKHSPVEEFADYLECECLRNGKISIYEAIKPVLYLSDELINDGIEDESDQVINKIEDVLSEIERRKKISSGKYPFIVVNKGYALNTGDKNHYYWLYIFLLYATRIDMQKNKILDNIDGTALFETLSALVAKQYFGEKSDSIVFGTTGDIKTFEKKISVLCQKTGEGHSFLNRDGKSLKAQDDKLDVVVWKHFTDNYRSKLLGFGQCKTGTSWDDSATIELQPDYFCDKWLRDSPTVTPVKMFFSSQYFPLDQYSKMKNAGLVFDRFRILDQLPDIINADLLKKIISWTKKAIAIKSVTTKSKKNSRKKRKK